MVPDSHPVLHLQEVPGEVVDLEPDPGAAAVAAAAVAAAAVEKNNASLLGEQMIISGSLPELGKKEGHCEELHGDRVS